MAQEEDCFSGMGAEDILLPAGGYMGEA